MDLSTFIISVFCLIDDRLEGRRIRRRGPSPKLSDAEVLTIELVGEDLGMDKLARGMGVELLAPYSSKKLDPNPKRSAFLSRLRYRIDTDFSQLVGRYCVKRVWARDTWHLASRLLRKALSHTVAFLLNHWTGNPPLQLAKLLQ